MTPRPVRVLAAATLVAAAGLLVPVPGPPAAVAAATACSTVSVVVDRGTLGGGASTRCTSGNPSTGLAALSQSGHSYTLVQTEPFVCRIDGVPSSDPCTRTPPSTAYWSYWHAKPGGSWTYASQGAYSYDPAPGSVEGWAFGAGKPPSTPPPAPRPAPAPTTAAPQPTSGSGGGAGTSGTAVTRHSSSPHATSARPSASVLGSRAAATGAATPGGTAAASAATSSSAPPSDAADGQAAAPDPGSGDGAVPAPLVGLAGAILVGGLGGAAWWRARRGTDRP